MAPQLLVDGRARISDVLTDANGLSFVSIDVPVRRNGVPAFALAVSVPTQQLTEVLQTQRFAPAWLATLPTRRGVVTAPTRNAERLSGELAVSGLRAAIRQHQSGFALVVTQEQVPMLAAYARSPQSAYTTVIGVPLVQIVGPLW